MSYLVPPNILNAWEEGVAFFNQGLYWEAHESWEYEWKTLPEAHRKNIQALIQTAAVFVHLKKNDLKPALRLARSALEKWASARSLGVEALGDRLDVPGFDVWLSKFLAAPQSYSSSEFFALKARLRSSKS